MVRLLDNALPDRTVREAATFTQANRNTIKNHLSKLVVAGRLIKRGQGRGTWYEKANDPMHRPG